MIVVGNVISNSVRGSPVSSTGCGVRTAALVIEIGHEAHIGREARRTGLELRAQGIAWWADYFDAPDLTLEAIELWLDRAGPGPGLELFSPMLANVRGDPRFKAIVRERGYYDYWKSTGEWSDYCRPFGENDLECDVIPERQ